MSVVDSALFQRVQHYAAYHDFDTAIFIAEQLFAAFKQAQQQALQQTPLSAILASYLPPAASQPQPAAASALLHPLILLLAQCYINSGASELPRAYHLLSTTLLPLASPSTSAAPLESEPQHRYLLALVCSRLDKLQEAELCLLPLLTHPSFSSLPVAASSLSLLGCVCQRTGRVDEAVRYHQRALDVDGLLWSSYSALCQLGVAADVSDLFTVDVPTSSHASPATFPLPSPHIHWPAVAASSLAQPAALHTPQPPSQHAVEQSTQLAVSTLHSTPTSDAATPRTRPPAASHSRAPSSSLKASATRRTPTTAAAVTPLAAGQQRLGFQTTKPRKDAASTSKPLKQPKARAEPNESSGLAALHSRTKSWSSVTPLTGMVRKRLDEVADMDAAGAAGAATEEAENELKEDRGAVMDMADASPSPSPPSRQLSEDEGEEESRQQQQDESSRRSAAQYTSLLRTLASAHSALSLCHPRTCIRLLSSLSFDHSHTPFALSSLARAHFDLADYPTALRHWQQLRALHPHHTHSLDLYSTALWQCKRDTLLASLAHSLTPFHAHTAVACVVLGNTFSLQREHDVALRFFRRAVQLDARYAYGWVLVGHECVALEEWERATEAYRRAVGEDGRVYGGWYGLGQVYFQQEKWSSALYHFQRASAINQHSPLLRVYTAMTLVQLRQLDDALQVLLDLDAVQQAEDDMADAAVPGAAASERTERVVHPQLAYQLANLYVLREEWPAALRACERLEAAVWREAAVYVLLGRVHRALGDVDAAMRAFVMALELDVKDSNGVKGMMEAMCKREAKRKAAAARGEQLVEEVEEQEMDVGY